MKKILIITTFASILCVPTFALADTVPCEDALKTLRDTETAVKPTGDIAAQVKVLEDKAVERCNADDDKRADGFAADAMKLMGK